MNIVYSQLNQFQLHQFNTWYGITFSDATIDELSAPLNSLNILFEAEALASNIAAHNIDIKN